MTELKRLEISGIRIFKEGDPQIIDFEPITLIVGANGTGKSTIIEALKFATIGKLQREMITFPDIWGKDKTESKVSLTFQSYDQNNYEIELSPSISKSSNNRLSFQTGNCDVTIRTPKNKQKYDSFKPTEIEKKVPKFFGVSPSIIENVIFCDQKQSCWPIDDKPPILKQKFDQFFNTDRYNDAIEALNETKKLLTKQMNEHSLEIARQEQRMNSYNEHKNKKIELEKKISLLNEEITKKQAQYDESQSMLEDYERIKPKIEDIKKDIKKKKAEKQTESAFIEDLISKITDLQPPDSIEPSIKYNESDINSNRERLEFNERLFKQQNEKLNLIDNEKKLIKEKVDQKNKNLEEIQSAREIFKASVNEFVEKYKTDNYEEVFKRESQSFDQAQKNFDDLKNQVKSEIDQKDIEISEMKDNLSKENAELSTSNTLLNENKRELSKVGQIDEKKLKEVEEIANKANQKLNDFIKSNKNLQEIEEEINKQKLNLLDIENKQKSLKEIKEECQKHENDIEKIKESNKQIKQANEIIHSQLEIIKNALNIQEIEPINAQQILEDKIKELKNKNNSIKMTNFQYNKNLNEITVRLETERSTFEQNENEINESKLKIEKVFKADINGYANECESKENNLKIESMKLAVLQNSETVFNDFKEKANNIVEGYHHCPLCGERFKSDKKFNEFINKINDFIFSLPKKIENSKSEIENLENRLNDLKSINDYVRIFKQNQDKRDKINEQIQSDQIKEEELKIQINEITTQIEFNDKKFDEIRELKENVIILNQAMQQLKEAENRKSEISSRINNELPSIDDIQFQEVQLHEEYSSIMSNINNLYKNGNQYSIKRNSLEKESDKADSKLNEIKEKFNRKIQLDNKIDELHIFINTKKQNIDNLNQKIIELNKGKQNLIISYQKQIDEKEKVRDEFKTEFQFCSSLIKRIKKSEEKLNEVDPNDISNQLEELQKQLEQKKEEFDKVNNTIMKQLQNLQKLKSEAELYEKERLNLQYQFEYYQRLGNFQLIQNELKRLKLKKLNELGELRKYDYDQLKTETVSIDKDLIKLKTQRDGYQIQFDDEEMSMGDYHSSFRIFNEAQIQLSIIEKSKSDIERYTKNLSKIILDFHSQKMEEINEIIYNLWQNTYYGRDVETVLIRCEKESEKDARIQYNYKVVMVKNDIEMDMSKCASAGQKMLASIIIRLALAKTFASNCRIIAFDEPTTNVDKMNIKSFAKELINLFKFDDSDDDDLDDLEFDDDDDDLRGKKRFQLIIISHDSNFVQILNEEGMLNNFYHIESNIDGGQASSQIVQKKINESY